MSELYDSIQSMFNLVSRLERHLKIWKIKALNSRLYEPTRLKMYKLAQRLEKCANLAYELSRSSREVDVESRYEKKQENRAKQISSHSSMEEESATKELPDPFPLNSKADVEPSQYQLSPKQIVREYMIRSNKLASSVANFHEEGVTKCAALMSEWLQVRFSKSELSNFYYNASNIGMWVDKFIMSFAYHWKYRITEKFELDFRQWITEVRTHGNDYPLPKFIFDVEEDGDDVFSPESIYLERVLKIVMYDRNFFPDNLHSVEDTVTAHDSTLYHLSNKELKERFLADIS